MKKTVSILMAAAMVASLAGCTKISTPETTAAQTQAENAGGDCPKTKMTLVH